MRQEVANLGLNTKPPLERTIAFFWTARSLVELVQN